MLHYLRGVAFGAAALAVAAGFGPAVQAAPTFPGAVTSTSGNLVFEIFDAICKTGTCNTAIEVVPFQQDAFRIQGANGAPLVALGDDLALFFTVTGVGSFTLDRWKAELLGAPGSSMGENLFDEAIIPGNGLGTILITGGQVGQANFPYATGAISGDKDLNALQGEIIGVVQGIFTTGPVPVPAPAGFAMLVVGLAGLAAIRRRRLIQV